MAAEILADDALGARFDGQARERGGVRAAGALEHFLPAPHGVREREKVLGGQPALRPRKGRDVRGDLLDHLRAADAAR